MKKRLLFVMVTYLASWSGFAWGEMNNSEMVKNVLVICHDFDIAPTLEVGHC